MPVTEDNKKDYVEYVLLLKEVFHDFNGFF